jgi:DNA polymerase (family 10)
MMTRNRDIARIFEKVAELLSLQDANSFRIRAYRNAATVISRWPEELSKYVSKKMPLPKLPGIGTDLDNKIREILSTSHLSLLDDLATRIPITLTELMDVGGLGPKRVRAIWKRLDVTRLAELKDAARSGKISRIPGFGKILEKKILESIESMESSSKRFPYTEILDRYRILESYWKTELPDVPLLYAGSLRRCRDTVGDLDLLAFGTEPERIMRGFKGYPDLGKKLFEGKTHLAARQSDGLQLDLRVFAPEEAGAAMLYFTGSKNHNIAIRRLARDQGWKLNEYGLFEGKKRIAGKTEAEVYLKLGLDFIPPELREDRGELDVAGKGALPFLLDSSMIRGDLHLHSVASDGSASIEEWVQAARKKKYDYIAITDHSKSLRIAKGLDSRRLGKQYAEIDRLNEIHHPFVILKGVEVDILENGDLDLPDSILRKADIVIGAIHSHFNLEENQQTDRILHAFDRKYFHVFGHPGGRLIGKRASSSFDLEKVARAAADRSIAMELNAQPLRMDLNGDDCFQVASTGCLFSIGTDAHSTGELEFMESGVRQARRGWLTGKQVINSFSRDELIRFLRKNGDR